jgi:hypothetical protein
MYHNATSIPERDLILKKIQNAKSADFPEDNGLYLGRPHANNPAVMIFAESVPKIHDFITVGYSNTLGWAHAHTGDTMTSVMIGGLRTVMNGDFEVFTGDLIQWYWPFERRCFTKQGRRKPRAGMLPDGLPNLQVDPDLIPVEAQNVNWALDKDSQQRQKFFDQQYGDRKGREKVVALIKPYKRDDEAPRIYDWYRVFAVALCSARPREKVDIRISRQAL